MKAGGYRLGIRNRSSFVYDGSAAIAVQAAILDGGESVDLRGLRQARERYPLHV